MLGHEIMAVARGRDRAEPACGLGTHHYIDSSARVRLKELGADLTVFPLPPPPPWMSSPPG